MAGDGLWILERSDGIFYIVDDVRYKPKDSLPYTTHEAAALALKWFDGAAPGNSAYKVLHEIGQKLFASDLDPKLDLAGEVWEAFRDGKLYAFKSAGSQKPAGGGFVSRPLPAPPSSPVKTGPSIHPGVCPEILPARVELIVKRFVTDRSGKSVAYTKAERVRITLKADSTFDGTAVVTRSSTKAKFFSAASGGVEITFNGRDNVLAADRMPPWVKAGWKLEWGIDLYAEGAIPSEALDDSTITLELRGGSKPVGSPDTCTITCIRATLDIGRRTEAEATADPRVEPAMMSQDDKILVGCDLYAQTPDRTQERALLIVRKVEPKGIGKDLVLWVVGDKVELFAQDLLPPGTGPALPPDKPLSSAQGLSPGSLPKRFWVQAKAPGDFPRDIAIRLGIKGLGARGIDDECDRVHLTAHGVRLARLVGMFFDTNKCFILPSAMRGIRGVVQFCRRIPEAELLVAGHTDTAGGDSYNLDLSLERAESVAAYLRNDVAAWLAWFASGKPFGKRWGTREVQLMLTALPEGQPPFYQGEPDGVPDEEYRAALKAFQKSVGLPETGKVDGATLRELIRAYMQLQGTTLPESMELVTHGCGESFPEQETGDGKAAQENRRVEIFVFEGPIDPKPPGKTSRKGSTEYPKWRERVVETADFRHGTLSVLARDEDGVPIAGATVEVTGPSTGSALTDDEGFAHLVDLADGPHALTSRREGFSTALGKVDVPLREHASIDACTPEAKAKQPPTGEPRVDVWMPATDAAVVVGVTEDGFSSAKPLELELVEVALIPDGGSALAPQIKQRGNLGQVFARFERVAFGDYEVRADRHEDSEYIAVTTASKPLAVKKEKINPATRQIEVDLHLESCRLALTFKDPVDGAVVPPSRIASVTLSPPPKAELDRTNFIYQVEKGIDYGVIIEPKRGLYFETIVRRKIQTSDTKLEVKLNRRTKILYVEIDQVRVGDHEPNIDGLKAAAHSFSPDLEVKRISWPELHGKTAEDIESIYHPFMLFSGGSFTEWFHYGDDATWRAQLDGYAAMIRSMDFPTLAVCGSHQFVAIAYAGWGAVGHMNNQGMPVPIQTELSLQQPAFMAPNPRVGEIGDYPIAVSPGASSDPLVKALPPSLVFSQFHRDMVLEGKYSPQFIPIFEADLSRTPVITPDDKDPQQKKVANPRCKVQGLKLNSSSRLLYTVQFHPERDPEEESDDKHGRKLLLVFFRLAKEWWEKL